MSSCSGRALQWMPHEPGCPLPPEPSQGSARRQVSGSLSPNQLCRQHQSQVSWHLASWKPRPLQVLMGSCRSEQVRGAQLGTVIPGPGGVTAQDMSRISWDPVHTAGPQVIWGGPWVADPLTCFWVVLDEKMVSRGEVSMEPGGCTPFHGDLARPGLWSIGTCGVWVNWAPLFPLPLVRQAGQVEVFRTRSVVQLMDPHSGALL